MMPPAAPPGRVSFGALLLGSGPRFARDALGPVLAFYVAWKLAGLLAGVVALLRPADSGSRRVRFPPDEL